MKEVQEITEICCRDSVDYLRYLYNISKWYSLNIEIRTEIEVRTVQLSFPS